MIHLFRSEKGQSMMELSIIIMVVSLIAVAFLSAIGITITDVFDSLIATFTGVNN